MNMSLNHSIDSQVAVVWDWQNCRANENQIQSLLWFAGLKGVITCKRAYSDWQLEKNREIPDLLYGFGFEQINIPSFKRHPNRTDQKLIHDCKQHILDNAAVKTVILLSGDRDFLALVRDLKAQGKQVIIISGSPNNTSRKLQGSPDEFHFINEIQANFIKSLPLAA